MSLEPSLVGRAAELAELSGAVRAASERRGSVWLVAGEAGVGKSRLVEEVARRAAEAGSIALFGRCWEAGGAPSFWPWIQVIRAVLRQRGPVAEAISGGGGARYLAQILPELGTGEPEDAPRSALAPAQARFQLLDAVVGALCDAAEETPLTLVLEDMHAADASSLAVLELLAGQAGAARLVVLVTTRHLENLTRIGRAARSLTLGRFGPEDVREYLRAETGEAPAPEVVDALHRWTEGNALFLVETARWLMAHGELERFSAAAAPTLPRTVMSAIEGRLADASPTTRALLEVAAILGRDVDAKTVEALSGASAAARQAATDEAVRLGVLHQSALGRHRFSHILVREALYAAIPETTRQEQHARLAEHLEQSGSELAAVAHHWSLAGERFRKRASLAHERAAEAALEQLALDEAVDAYTRALALSGADPRRDAELTLGLGRAAMLVGDAERCRAACDDAARVAREQGDPILLARAALTRGGIFTYGVVDPDLVSMLEAALASLDDGDPALRARVQARLAAAVQPSDDPQVPMRMAREAITMARSTGEPRTILDALRSGCSALMDLAQPEERLALNEEHVSLALSIGDKVEALRGNMRLCFDAWELGDDARASLAVEACDRIASELDHPFHRWRATALLAARSMRWGRFRESEQLHEDAVRESQSARDPNARIALLFQRYCLLRVQGRFAELKELFGELDTLIRAIDYGQYMQACMVAQELARMGRIEEARARFDAKVIELGLSLGDRSLLAGVAQIAPLLGLADLCKRTYEAMLPYSGRFVSWGILAMAAEGPVDHSLALLAAGMGQHELAQTYFERAVAQTRAAAAPAWLAWIRLDQARITAERGTPGDDEGARALLGEAESVARELGIPGVLEIADRLRAQVRSSASGPPAAASAGDGVSIVQEGGTWTIAFGRRVLHMEDTRGVQLLAQLVAAPGKEIHALELSGRPDPTETRDAGDAGEVLDARARAEYRRRVVDLREELEEAESWSDAGRAERLREELAFLEAELSRAVGLGGRPRRASTDSERARVNVQRRLKDAVRRIRRQDAVLGEHFEQALRTGMYCAYEPLKVAG